MKIIQRQINSTKQNQIRALYPRRVETFKIQCHYWKIFQIKNFLYSTIYKIICGCRKAYGKGCGCQWARLACTSVCTFCHGISCLNSKVSTEESDTDSHVIDDIKWMGNSTEKFTVIWLIKQKILAVI